MARGVHGEKIVSAIQSNKMPVKDVPRLEMTACLPKSMVLRRHARLSTISGIR